MCCSSQLPHLQASRQKGEGVRRGVKSPRMQPRFGYASAPLHQKVLVIVLVVPRRLRGIRAHSAFYTQVCSRNVHSRTRGFPTEDTARASKLTKGLTHSPPAVAFSLCSGLIEHASAGLTIGGLAGVLSVRPQTLARLLQQLQQ